MHDTDKHLGQALVQQVIGLDYHILMEDYIHSIVDFQVMRLIIQFKEDDLETSAFGIMFTLSALSFHDARPGGTANIGYQKTDEWTIRDFLQNLSFACGKLQFHAGYVRGRLMKTEISVSSDGLMVIETRNRGRSASRWVTSLRGKVPFITSKKSLFVVKSGEG